jgi:hypothetical protein
MSAAERLLPDQCPRRRRRLVCRLRPVGRRRRLLGGFLIGAGLALNSIFYVLTGIAVLGFLLTVLVPRTRGPREVATAVVEPTRAQATPLQGGPSSSRAGIDPVRDPS